MKPYHFWIVTAIFAMALISCRPAAEPAEPAVQPVSLEPTAAPQTERVGTSLLGQIPEGYSNLARWDVEQLLTGDDAEALVGDFSKEWIWIEEYGLDLEQLTEVVRASDEEDHSLLLFSGEFDWDLIHNHLYYAGFVDSTYREEEVWKHPQQDTVFSLLPDRNLIIASTTGNVPVRETVRSYETGEGFLFEDLTEEGGWALEQAKEGFHLVWEDGCGRLDLRSCSVSAYSAKWGEDPFSVSLTWFFGFDDTSSASTAVKKLETIFEDIMPREVTVSQLVQDGQFVIVEASLDKDQFAFLSEATEVDIRPEPEVLPRPAATPTPVPLEVPVLMERPHANQVYPPAGLVAWWPGDGNSNDIIGSNHGTLHGGVAFAPGVVGQAFVLDGQNDLIEMADHPSLSINGDMTVELWAKRMVSGQPAQIVAKGTVTDETPPVFALGFERDRPRGIFHRDDNSKAAIYAQALTDNEFHHYAYVRKGNTHQIFVDGELIESTVFTGAPADSTDLPFVIGAIKDETSPLGHREFFGGMVDEVSLYNRALTEEEVVSVFNSGVAGKTKPISAYCREWDLGKEFRIAPYQENPNRDGCGNLDVWHFLQTDASQSTIDQPSQYQLLGRYSTHMQFTPGLEHWQGSYSQAGSIDRLPAIGLNTTGSPQEMGGLTWPHNQFLIQMHPQKLAVVGWQSPIDGSVTITARLADHNPDCGDGTLWSISHFNGDLNRTLARGTLANGASLPIQADFQNDGLAGLKISRGDFVYLLLAPVRQGVGCDATGVSLTIMPHTSSK